LLKLSLTVSVAIASAHSEAISFNAHFLEDGQQEVALLSFLGGLDVSASFDQTD
jgi:hypothetical protein